MGNFKRWYFVLLIAGALFAVDYGYLDSEAELAVHEKVERKVIAKVPRSEKRPVVQELVQEVDARLADEVSFSGLIKGQGQREPARAASPLRCKDIRIYGDGPGATDQNCGTGNSDCGQKIYALQGGVVTRNSGQGYGTLVAIKNGKCVSIYAHLATVKSNARVGKTVKAGDVIGTMGNTGASRTCHLHYEPCNKRLYKTTGEAELPWGTVPMGESSTVEI